MYLIVDLETRAVLTNRDGVDIFHTDEALARNAASIAQNLANHPHAVLAADPHECYENWGALPAHVARGNCGPKVVLEHPRIKDYSSPYLSLAREIAPWL